MGVIFERGSESVQWGKLFQVLDGLGIHVELDVIFSE
jgi:hypothetical protein